MNDDKTTWLDKPVFESFPKFSWEMMITTIIIVAAILSRFMILGERVMSHDEVNHVVPSYSLYQGQGYAHDPVTHGPFQFHMLALSYFLLGDSDFSARVPAAIFSILAILTVLLLYKSILGRVGALIGAGLLLVSPFILYYGRYTRNEAFIELFAVLTLYGCLRYFSKKDRASLYLLAVVTALQFATKETAYIYTAQLLLFCGIVFLNDLFQLDWESSQERLRMALLPLCSLLFIGAAWILNKAVGEPENRLILWGAIAVAVLGLGCLVFWVVLMVRRFRWKTFRALPSFNLIVFIGALILPQLTAFPVLLLGWDPLDYSQAGMLHTGIVMVVLLVISFAIGIWWNREVFLKAATAFYLIFIVFYTTFFSNGQGFFTGVVGSLGYWLSQHAVQRGGQPGYYYGGILLPIYEFAAILGFLIAVVYAIRYNRFWQTPSTDLADVVIDSCDEDSDQSDVNQKQTREELHFNVYEEYTDERIVSAFEEDSDTDEVQVGGTKYYLVPEFKPLKIPVMLLFVFWTLTSLVAYSIAGEKMPWLAVHIAIPLALTAAWGFGLLVETAAWEKIRSASGWIGLAALVVACFALGGVLSGFFGNIPPFQGSELDQLRASGKFVFALIGLLISLGVLLYSWKNWSRKAVSSTILLFISVIMIGLQARTAYQASFINYNYANELLVYAHAAPGPKIVLEQIEEIAERTGQGKSIKVAYDNDGLYPYWWYFRDYPAKYFFDANPTRELRNYDIIIANLAKEAKLEPVVRNEYYRYETVRLWWPNQDYFNISWNSILNTLRNPAMRKAILDIWLNRDYTKYAQVTGKNSFTPETWSPSDRMVVYMRKSLMSSMWQLGDTIQTGITGEDGDQVFADERFVQLDPVFSLGVELPLETSFKMPRNVAVSNDGTIYVVDSDNNRIERFSPTGKFLNSWDAKEQGGLNQPWGIAINPSDGSVFLADTWNHRILKFDGEGTFLLSWYASDPSQPERTFYGPRALVIDSHNRIYITDTGNKQIVVYTTDGKFLTKFGTAGMAEGEFDEPVGLALMGDNLLAVADTWNQRVQLFTIEGDIVPVIRFKSAFNVAAWYSQSLDNKPYLAFDTNGNILITDPESGLIWLFSQEGTLLRSWNGAGGDIDRASMPTGITVDSNGAVWVVDTAGNRVNKFILPAETVPEE